MDLEKTKQSFTFVVCLIDYLLKVFNFEHLAVMKMLEVFNDFCLFVSSLSSRTGLDERHADIRSSAHFSEVGHEKDRETDGGMEGEIVCDLSSALQELHRAEREVELHPEHAHSHHMWAQRIRKIRLELSHLHQALQRTAQGPLDLSVKKEPVAMTTTPLGDNQEMKQVTDVSDCSSWSRT